MLPSIKKILYTTDLSPNSVYALRYAISTAILHDAEIIILHVFEHVDPASRAMLNVFLDEKKHKEIAYKHTLETQDLIMARLRAIRDKEFKDHPEYTDKVTSIEVCEGFAAEKILNKAETLNCDVIIMGTHSKGIIANTFLGSTAKRVLRRARKPVYIIPLPKEKTDMARHDM